MKLRQGNTYVVPFELKYHGNTLTNEEISKIEFTLGNLVKMYPEDIKYEDGKFVLELSQEDTFSLNGNEKFQVRTLFPDGSVKCTEQYTGQILYSLSKAVLKNE